MVPDKDYFIVEPKNYSRLTSSIIIFKRTINTDDAIDITFTGIKGKCFANYTSILSTNTYGFIYFDTLNIPFSL